METLMLGWLRPKTVDFTPFVRKVQVLNLTPGSVVYIELNGHVPESYLVGLQEALISALPRGVKFVVSVDGKAKVSVVP